MRTVLDVDHPFQDFRVFLTAVWDFLGLPTPTRIQLDMAKSLQGGSDRMILEAFRGVGKSWITCAFAAWNLLHDPELKIEIVSAGETLAFDNSIFISQMIREIPFLQHLQPLPTQRSSNIAFDVGGASASKDPSVKAVGILGQITGTRADLIIADDIEIPKNASSQPQRDKIRQLVTEFESILKPEGGRIIYLGTPQLGDSLYTNLPSHYKVLVYPAEYPDMKRCKLDYDKLSKMLLRDIAEDPNIIGAPTEPKRFPSCVLLEKKAGMGASNYQLQMMLDTNMSDDLKYPLKLSDLIVMSVNRFDGFDRVYHAQDRDTRIEGIPNVGIKGDYYYRPLKCSQGTSPYERIILAIDPSGKGQDETSYCVLGQLHSQLYLMSWGGKQGGYNEETLQFLAKLAEEFIITDCVIEQNFGGGTYSALFQPYLNRLSAGRCKIKDVHVHTQKEVRIIDTLEPLLNQHRLIVDQKLIQEDYNSVGMYSVDTQHRYRGFYQLSHITRDRNSLGKDDRIDVLQLGCSQLMLYMNVDVAEAEAANELRDATAEERYWVSEFGSSFKTNANAITCLKY